MHNMHIWISYYDVHVCKSSLEESESLHFKPNFFCTYHLINIIFQTCNQYLIKYWCSIKTVYIFIQVFENQKKKWKKWWKAVFEMCNDLRYSNVSKTFFFKDSVRFTSFHTSVWSSELKFIILTKKKNYSFVSHWEQMKIIHSKNIRNLWFIISYNILKWSFFSQPRCWMMPNRTLLLSMCNTHYVLGNTYTI